MNFPPNEKPTANGKNPVFEQDSRQLFSSDELAELLNLLDSDEAARADSPGENQNAQADEKYVVFDLDEKSYAVHSHQVVEVFGAPAAVTPLPNAPSWLAGIASLRGEITPIVDLRRLWRRETPAPARKKAIILRSAKTGAHAAFLVDKLNEIVTLSPQDIKFSAADFEASFPAVFGRAASGERQLFLLDAENLLGSLIFDIPAAR